MKTLAKVAALSSLMLIGGCVSTPTGPSVMALPGTDKNFDQFRMDDAECRQYALSQAGGATADQAATDAGIRSAAVGTVVGAVAGAAIGGHDGAGVGAGTGLLVGSMAGTGAAQSSAYGTQRHYDNAYVQCMYAKGEKVPVSGTVARSPSPALHAAQPAPASAYPPPPPPRDPSPVAVEPAPQYWYYCTDPAGYYPYIAQCRVNWQRVPATPQPGSPPIPSH